VTEDQNREAQREPLINELPGGSTPLIDGYEVRLAFENVNDHVDALKWFDRASAAPGPANYRTSALEDEAAVRFGLGGSPNAMAARAEVQRAIELERAKVTGYVTELDPLLRAADAAVLNCSHGTAETFGPGEPTRRPPVR
jgi:hypothetical protein